MSRALVVEHANGAGPGRLTSWLPEGGVELEVVRPHTGEAVPQRADVDALVVLGGPMGAYDDTDAPWLPATRELLRLAVKEEVPTLGICLGAQLLAAACGGEVEPGSQGPEVGATALRPHEAAGTDALLGDFANPTYVVEWHYDAITELPADAVPLASTATYQHQAYRLGDRAWGVQFHPEASLSSATSWAARGRNRLRDHGVRCGPVLGEVAGRERRLSATGRRLAERFAAVVTAS